MSGTNYCAFGRILCRRRRLQVEPLSDGVRLVAPLDLECVSDRYALCEGHWHLHHRVGGARFAWVRLGWSPGIEGPPCARARCFSLGAPCAPRLRVLCLRAPAGVQRCVL